MRWDSTNQCGTKKHKFSRQFSYDLIQPRHKETPVGKMLQKLIVSLSKYQSHSSVPRLSLEWRTEVVCPHVKSPPSELARDVKQPCLGQSPKQLTKVFFSKVYPAYASSKLRGFIRNQADQKGWPHCPPPSQFRYFIPHGQPYQNLPSKETQDNLVLNPLFFLQLCSGLATDILLLLSALCTLHTAEQNFTTCEKQNSSNKLARPVQHLSNVSVFLRESIESITHITILAGNISTQNTRNI